MAKPFKTVINADTGTADKYGGDDIDNIATFLNNQSDFHTYTYFVYKDGTTYKAKNGATGEVAYTHASDCGALLASIFNGVSATTPLEIQFEADEFTIKSWGEANFRHSNFTIKGAGSGLTTFVVHNDVFNIAGQNRVFAFEAAGSAFTSNTIQSNAPAGSWAVLTNTVTDLAVGDHVVVGSTAVIAGSAEAGEHNRIVKIVATGGSPSQRIILEKSTRYAYNTADSAFIRKVGFLENNRIEGITIKSNQDLTSQIAFMRLDFNYDFHMNDVQFKDWGVWTGGGFHHCFINNSVVNSYFNDLMFENSPERGHSTGGAGGNENPNGYAISTRGGSETVYYTNCNFKGLIRHCFTTTSNGETAKNGQPINIWLINCNAETTTEASFDTHAEGSAINFINCSVHSTRSAGATDSVEGAEDTDAFNSRSNNTRFINCSVVGIRGKGFSCDGTTSGNVFDGCYVDGCSKSSFGITPSGTNTIARNCIVKNVDGDGISVGDGSTGIQISNCFIKNAARTDDTKIPLYIGNCSNVSVDHVMIDRSNDEDVVPIKTHASSSNITFSNIQLIGTGAEPSLSGTNIKWDWKTSIGRTIQDLTYKISKYLTTYQARKEIGGQVISSSADLTVVLNAVIADISPAGTPAVIEIDAGDYNMNTALTAFDSTKIGNITIKGKGKGITNLILTTSITGNPTIFSFAGAVSGSQANLTANATSQGFTVTIADTTNFAVNDYVLLRSTKDWVTGGQGKQGEIRQIRSKTATDLTFDGPIQDTYNTADTANVIKLVMLKNVTLEDFTIKPVSGSYTQTGSYIDYRFCRNSTIRNVEVYNMPGSQTNCTQMRSCIDSEMDHVTAILEEGFPLTGDHPYALKFGACCQRCTMESCEVIGPWRHLVASDGSTSTNSEGVGRGITIVNCRCVGIKDSAYDTHETCEDVLFDHCVVEGGEEHGFNVRSPGVRVQNCTVEGVDDYGIYCFGDANDVLLIGNKVRRAGSGIRLTGGATNINIIGNVIQDCDAHGIYLDSSTTDVQIVGNEINNCTISASNAGIYDNSGAGTPTNRITLSSNRIRGNHRAIRMLNDSTGWKIIGNTLENNNNTSTLVGTNIRFGNTGDANVTDNVSVADSQLSSNVVLENQANTWTSGSQTFQSNVDINKDIHLTGVISPSQITSDQNDYNPTNFLTSNTVRLDTDSSFRTISGLGNATQTNGHIVKLRNISANTILLADEATTAGQLSTAANRFAFGGYDIPIFPKSQISLQYDGTLSRWILEGEGQGPIIPHATQGFYARTDCISSSIGTNSDMWFHVAPSGGTLVEIASTAGHPGIIESTLGTSTTGSGALRINGNAFLVGNSLYYRFDAVIKLVALSDGTNTYTARIGFIDSGTAESTDGCFFRYTHSVNSGKWQKVTRNNGTETGSANDTGSTADTNWHRFTVIINPAGTNVQFFIDGTSVGTETTNIPTGAGRNAGGGFMFLKSAGTANNIAFDLDAISVLSYTNVTRAT